MYLEKNVTRFLADLRKPKKNIRKHSQSQIDEYKRSIEKNGQLRPIIVDEQNVVWCGNGLWQAMTELGYEKADVYVVHDATEKDLVKLMMSDNRIFNLGSDDMGVFEEFVAELGGDFDVPGYDMDLLKTLSFDSDDVDEIQSNYGKITEEDKEALHKAEEKYIREAEEHIATATRYEPEPEPESRPAVESVPKERELERRYIICPKCGEKIWL